VELERRQRWAAFSVRAHRNLRALAADLLLYDRIILPVPEDEPEYHRWVRNRWDPDAIALRVVQSGGLIIPVPWTQELRAEWQNHMDQMRQLGREVAYGMTGHVYAAYPAAWTEIAAGLQPDELPERKPAVLAGFQSAREARAELELRSAGDASLGGPAAVPVAQASRTAAQPGTRPADRVVALHVRRIVHEPKYGDPEQAFLGAVALVENKRFQTARRKLFNLEDDLYVDGWEPDEVEAKIAGLEEEYRDAVRAHTRQTRRRRVATLLPSAVGWGTVAVGHPHAKGVISKSLSLMIGRFASLDSPDPENHPGASFAMVRAAYRMNHTTPDDRSAVDE
jgi:hypothetical protein